MSTTLLALLNWYSAWLIWESYDVNWNLLAMHHASRSVQSQWTGKGIRASAILAALDQSASIQSQPHED
jgi:hypothetical protein